MMLEYVDVAAVAAYFSEASGPSPSTDLAGALVVLWRPGLQIKPAENTQVRVGAKRRSWKLWARARIILLWLYLWMSLLMFTGRFLERLYILLFHFRWMPGGFSGDCSLQLSSCTSDCEWSDALCGSLNHLMLRKFDRLEPVLAFFLGTGCLCVAARGGRWRRKLRFGPASATCFPPSELENAEQIRSKVIQHIITYHPPILHDSIHPPSQVPIVSVGKGTDFAGLSMYAKIGGQSRPQMLFVVSWFILNDFDARCSMHFKCEVLTHTPVVMCCLPNLLLLSSATCL